jgi:crotonobetainyl-CoA:carnitine CoA-transferase CaiB-like acyl-CoA transferase
MQTSDEAPGGALSRYRVLELGSLVAGPFCGSFLADFGAEVIKLEQIEGDPVRAMGDRVDGKSLYGASMMRNKRLIAVDLRQPEGREIALKLAASCDVVIENFRPGVLERWGLSYETLRELNPALVMVRLSGFGQDGPYSPRPGYGVIGEAVSGLRYLIGDEDRPPARVAVPLTDYVAGLYAALGTLVALEHRNRTGQGQCVDASLFESAFSFLRSEVPSFDKLRKVAKRAGSRLPGHVPSNLFETADGGYIHISAGNNSLFRRLCHTMGQPELAEDPRFADPVERAANQDEIDRLIGLWVARWDLPTVEKMLVDAEVVASRVFTVEDIFADPHFQAREMLPAVPDDELGTLVMPGVVPKLSLTPGAIHRSGGVIGRDTRAVLRQYAALTEADLDALEARGVLRQARGGAKRAPGPADGGDPPGR